MFINNPINEGYYADPEARFYEGEFWIYATRSRPYKEQLNLDAFHSADGKEWIKEEGIIDMSGYSHVWQAVWAPTIIRKNGMYYLVFAVNDIQNNDQKGGLEIAVSNSPKGSFVKYRDTLVDRFYNKAQPIDAHLFKDDDDKVYLYYGGWGHCNVAQMNENLTDFVPFESGEVFREITPPEYVEGPCMMKKDGKYYFMWSVGGWGNDSYGVCYDICDSPLGPFEHAKRILKTDYDVAKGPGHHGFVFENNDCYIVYHRRPLSENDCNSRQLCIDKMDFDKNEILPIKMT